MWLEGAQAQSLDSDHSSLLGLRPHLSGISRWESGLNKVFLLLTVFEPHLVLASVFESVTMCAPALAEMFVSAAVEHQDKRE